MGPMYYIGLDVHKLKISYCVKDVIGKFMPKDGYPLPVLIWIVG
jgi:hypothetical protein